MFPTREPALSSLIRISIALKLHTGLGPLAGGTLAVPANRLSAGKKKRRHCDEESNFFGL